MRIITISREFGSGGRELGKRMSGLPGIDFRDIITGIRWGKRGSCHLIMNTTGWEIRELAPAFVKFAERWFGRTVL